MFFSLNRSTSSLMSREHTDTLQPKSISCFVSSKPMPFEAPVIMAVFFNITIFILCPFVFVRKQGFFQDFP